MWTWLRLTWRMHRPELAVLGSAVLVVIGGALWFGWQINALVAARPPCFVPTDGAVPSDCQAALNRLNDLLPWTGYLSAAAGVAPSVLGLFLGVPIVAREIEQRTAGMAWTLSPSRRRWLAARCLPVLAIVVVGLVGVGLATDWLQSATVSAGAGGIGFWRSFQAWPLLVARGLLSVAMGLSLGALVGRSLPALLGAAMVGLLVFMGITGLMERWMAAEAVPIAVTDEGAGQGSRTFDMGYRDDATGEVVTMSQYFATAEGQPMTGADDVPGMTMVDIAVPASRYPEFMLRESAINGALAVLFGGFSLFIVQRRRPD